MKFETCVWLMMLFTVIVTADSPQGPDRSREKNEITNSTVAGSISTSTGAPTTTKPIKLRRDSGHLTDNDVDGPPATSEGPPQIESVLIQTKFY